MNTPIRGLRSLLFTCSIVVVASLHGCGGGDGISAEPLISSTVVGEYEGTDFTPVNGFAYLDDGGLVVVLGTGSIGCGSESAGSPPRGYSAAAAIPEFTTGTYENVFVNLYKNVGGFEGSGSNEGTVMITAISTSSVVGEIEYERTALTGEHYSVIGSFTVTLCAS